jgi:hypothetical protein
MRTRAARPTVVRWQGEGHEFSVGVLVGQFDVQGEGLDQGEAGDIGRDAQASFGLTDDLGDVAHGSLIRQPTGHVPGDNYDWPVATIAVRHTAWRAGPTPTQTRVVAA